MLDKLFNRTRHQTVRNGVTTWARTPQVCAQWDYSRTVTVDQTNARALVRWAVFHGHSQDVAVRVVSRIYRRTTSRRAFELALLRETNK